MIKEFETSKGRFAFIQDNNIANLGNSSIGVYAVYNNGVILLYIEKAIFLGLAKDLTEEQWEKVVDFYELSNVRGWYDYTDDLPFPTEKQGLTKNATDSGKLLMESLELGEGNWFLVKFV